MNGRVSILKYHVLTGVSLEVINNFPLTAGHSALIFSQGLIKDMCESRSFFFLPAQASSLKRTRWKHTRAIHVGNELTPSSRTTEFRPSFSRSQRVLSPCSLTYFSRKNNDNNKTFLPKSSENRRQHESKKKKKNKTFKTSSRLLQQRKKKNNIKTLSSIRIKLFA